jgi:hypothetical protein
MASASRQGYTEGIATIISRRRNQSQSCMHSRLPTNVQRERKGENESERTETSHTQGIPIILTGGSRPDLRRFPCLYFLGLGIVRNMLVHGDVAEVWRY